MNAEFEQFVKLVGGPKAAYEHLECSETMVYRLRHGERSVTPKRAKRITDKYPQLSMMRLLFPKDAAA